MSTKPLAAAIISKKTPSELTLKFKSAVVAPPSYTNLRLSLDSTAYSRSLCSRVNCSNFACWFYKFVRLDYSSIK
jgi:hypothetical protein